jgi:hypothetical protein
LINIKAEPSKRAKLDIESASRNLAVHPLDVPLQYIQFQGDVYADLRLVFGARSSPAIFNAIAALVAWIAHHNYGLPLVNHYLDDYIVGDVSKAIFNARLRLLESLLKSLGLPVKQSKTEWASTQITHLGIHIDTVKMTFDLPPESRDRLRIDLLSGISQKYRTLKQYLSLKGWLLWIANICPPIRPFIQHLARKCWNMHVMHAKLSISAPVKSALRTILSIIDGWDGLFTLAKLKMGNPDLILLTDASDGDQGGCGIWIPTLNEYDILTIGKMDIHISEAIAATSAVLHICRRFTDKSILLYVDNSIVAHAMHRMSSKNFEINSLLESLALDLMRHRNRLQVLWIPTAYNVEADLLSRSKLVQFRQRHPQATKISVLVQYGTPQAYSNMHSST